MAAEMPWPEMSAMTTARFSSIKSAVTKSPPISLQERFLPVTVANEVWLRSHRKHYDAQIGTGRTRVRTISPSAASMRMLCTSPNAPTSRSHSGKFDSGAPRHASIPVSQSLVCIRMPTTPRRIHSSTNQLHFRRDELDRSRSRPSAWSIKPPDPAPCDADPVYVLYSFSCFRKPRPFDRLLGRAIPSGTDRVVRSTDSLAGHHQRSPWDEFA
jgi:hypothetical protein